MIYITCDIITLKYTYIHCSSHRSCKYSVVTLTPHIRTYSHTHAHTHIHTRKYNNTSTYMYLRKCCHQMLSYMNIIIVNIASNCFYIQYNTDCICSHMYTHTDANCNVLIGCIMIRSDCTATLYDHWYIH